MPVWLGLDWAPNAAAAPTAATRGLDSSDCIQGRTQNFDGAVARGGKKALTLYSVLRESEPPFQSAGKADGYLV